METIPSAGSREVTLPTGEVVVVEICGRCESAPVWASGRCARCYAREYARTEKARERTQERYEQSKQVRAALEAELEAQQQALTDDAAAVEAYVTDHPDEREAVHAFFSEHWEATLADYLAQKEGAS